MRVLLWICLMVFVSVAEAQDCNHLSFTKGATYEMENFDAKDKKSGSVKSSVKDVTSNGSKKEALIHSEVYNKKSEKEHEGDMKFTCDGGKIVVDISSMLNNSALASSKDMEVKMEGTFLEIPTTLSVGQTLPDGNATMKMLDKKSGDLFSTTNISIVNRKVESKETITTPAGTFETFKITYDIKTETTAMGMKLPGSNSKAIENYSSTIGLSVKTQTLDKKGGLVGYSLLTKYSK